jgi:hypothetical protein
MGLVQLLLLRLAVLLHACGFLKTRIGVLCKWIV